MDYEETDWGSLPCGYYIADTELKMLLAGCGIKRWYGLWLPAAEEPSQKQLAEAFISLHKKGYITWSEKVGEQTVKISEPLREVISVMTKAERCVLIRKREKDYSVKCCYLSDASVVIAERSQREKEMLRLTEYVRSEWMEWLWEEELFPREEIFLRGDFEGKGTKMLRPYREVDRYFEEDFVTAVFELLTVKDGRVKERVILGQNGIQCMVYVQHEMEIKNFIYKKDRCMQMTERWFQH